MTNFDFESLTHDPIHGYIPYISKGISSSETTERQLVDHPWIQRLRNIHQLQTAWWVFPTAEHTRFQHVLGAMHLGSRAAEQLYESLKKACPDLPSRGYVESLLRMAGLLHDVGHGPFGHFFDDQYLQRFRQTHETLGALIIESELGSLLKGIRRNPNSELGADERLSPSHVAVLIRRPSKNEESSLPGWLRKLRALLSGIYTIDNLDFVLRDAYMSGYSQQAFDLERLLHYSFYTSEGLTIHDRGLESLIRFMSARAELFRTIYFHRTVRAIDLELVELFGTSIAHLFPGDPTRHLDEYIDFTESSLLVTVRQWVHSKDRELIELGHRWRALMSNELRWKMVCQRNRVFGEGDAESSSIFTDASFVEHRMRELLPADLKEAPMRVDIARHIHRPHTRGPAGGQNYRYDPAHQKSRPLTSSELFERLPVSHRICRIYAESKDARSEFATALDELLGGQSADDLTNM